MDQVARRVVLSGAAALTSLALPSSSAAASDLEGGGPSTVAFEPANRMINQGSPPNTAVQVQMAWAEGYTSVGSFLTGTTGAKAPFTYVISTTDTADQSVTRSGSSDGSLADITGIASKIGTTITVTMTSTEFPSDARTFSRTR